MGNAANGHAISSVFRILFCYFKRIYLRSADGELTRARSVDGVQSSKQRARREGRQYMTTACKSGLSIDCAIPVRQGQAGPSGRAHSNPIRRSPGRVWSIYLAEG